MKIYSVNVVEKNPVPKSKTKPFYIGTKEEPIDSALNKTVDFGTVSTCWLGIYKPYKR